MDIYTRLKKAVKNGKEIRLTPTEVSTLLTIYQTEHYANTNPICISCGKEVEVHHDCGCGTDRAVFTEAELREREEQDRKNNGIKNRYWSSC
jgi:hypothetical protein